MPVHYLFSEFTSALLKNLTVYLEPGENHMDQTRAQLSLTFDRETAVSVYRSIVDGFKDSVYCEINEEYDRMKRYEDLLNRWEASQTSSHHRESLERLIVRFDLDNYAPPTSRGFLG